MEETTALKLPQNVFLIDSGGYYIPDIKSGMRGKKLEWFYKTHFTNKTQYNIVIEMKSAEKWHGTDKFMIIIIHIY